MFVTKAYRVSRSLYGGYDTLNMAKFGQKCHDASLSVGQLQWWASNIISLNDISLLCELWSHVILKPA